jgi:hypothetical protein
MYEQLWQSMVCCSWIGIQQRRKARNISLFRACVIYCRLRLD